MLFWFYCSGKQNFSFVLRFTNRCENWHFLHASYIENKVESSEKTDRTMLNTPWAVLVMFNFSQKFIMPCFYQTLRIVFPVTLTKMERHIKCFWHPEYYVLYRAFLSLKNKEWATYWQITNFEYRIILYNTIHFKNSTLRNYSA